MVPKKAKTVIPETAKELHVSEDLVGDIIDHFYKKIRSKMSELEDGVIMIENLGTFKVNKKKLLKSKLKYEKRLTRLPETDTFTKYSLRKDALDRITKLDKMLLFLEEEVERKQKVRDKRNEDNKDDNTNLE